MKIVINAFSARRGGGQTYLLNLLQHLGDFKDLSIIILAPDSLEVPVNPAITRLIVKWPTDNPLLRTLWEIFRLPKVLAKLNADVLFCPGGLINSRIPANCFAVTMSQNMIPFTPSIRQQYPVGWQRLRNWLLERTMLKSMAKADLVIFISEYAKEVIQTRLGRPLSRTVTIPHGISSHFRVNSRESLPRPGWLPVDDYLLYVSIFEPYKHHLEVVRGFHLLKSLRLTQEKLVLAGKNDMQAGKSVREEIDRLGLQNDVILTGNIPYHELPAVYAHAKINIFASTCENCPNILLEALGAGRPVLASNFRPMPEFGGDAVVYFDPFSPEDFARQLCSFIDIPERLDQLGKMAMKQSDKYQWGETARRTWHEIRELALAQERN